MKPTDALNSSFIGITTLHVSGSLFAHHQEFLAYIGFGTLHAVVTVCYQEQDGTEFHSTPGSKQSQLHKLYQRAFLPIIRSS